MPLFPTQVLSCKMLRTLQSRGINISRDPVDISRKSYGRSGCYQLNKRCNKTGAKADAKTSAKAPRSTNFF